MKNWFLGICAGLLIVAEVSLGPVLVTADGAGPDFILLLVVYTAMRAPLNVSPFFYLGAGTISDLLVVPQPGLRGFSYLMVAMAIERFRPGGNRRNPLIFAITCIPASFCVELIYLLVGMRGGPLGFDAGVHIAVKCALLTGLAGLLLGWPANLLARVFKWPPMSADLTWSQMLAAAAAGTARTATGRKD